MRCIMDSGAQRFYISKKVASELGLEFAGAEKLKKCWVWLRNHAGRQKTSCWSKQPARWATVTGVGVPRNGENL